MKEKTQPHFIVYLRGTAVKLTSWNPVSNEREIKSRFNDVESKKLHRRRQRWRMQDHDRRVTHQPQRQLDRGDFSHAVQRSKVWTEDEDARIVNVTFGVRRLWRHKRLKAYLQTMSTTIFQWNARSVVAHDPFLKRQISTSATIPDVICMQETFLHDQLRFAMENYNIERLNRPAGAHGGIIRTGITYSVLNNPSNMEALIVRLKLSTGDLGVVNVYHRPP